MNPSLFLLIASDPRTSPRPAEAIRIAAGLGTWRKVDVTVCLIETAVLALSEHTDELADGDYFDRYLPIIGELGRPIYVQHGTPWLSAIGQSSPKHQEIGPTEMAELAAKSDCVARF